MTPSWHGHSTTSHDWFDWICCCCTCLFIGRSPQVHIMKSYSDQALLELRAWRRYHEYYHLIYIDASHIAKDVLSDGNRRR